MHPNRRRKKRPNYGIRTVEVLRGTNGFGFTISGQQPCILSCIVANSPADHAGLRAGDFLISVNGISVSKITHDAVVNLIGNCHGPIRMTIAENYYSDSSEEELDVNRIVNTRKPKYMHKPRGHRLHKQQHHHQNLDNNTVKIKEKHHENVSNGIQMDDDSSGPIEYKVIVGYLGTIEMPKQLLPNSRLQTVCSCIKKLRQEKRTPTAILMTIFPTCLTLKNSSNHILAIYPINRVVYIGSTADKESKYFGLVTSAVMNDGQQQQQQKYDNHWLPPDEKKLNNIDNNNDIEISNSCHVFMVDSKITNHNLHKERADNFKITCTGDLITGNCLEFPTNALYIVNLIQNMYKLQTNNDQNKIIDENLLIGGPLVANSPQPSASSNSDSGIGFRDDCGNISDRILVVEFPAHHRPTSTTTTTNNHRPIGIDATNLQLDNLDLPLNNDNFPNFELNNIKCKNLDIKMPNNLSRSDDRNMNIHQKNNLNNIRACESINIKNILEKSSENYLLTKQNNNCNNNSIEDDAILNRLTCRALPDRSIKLLRGISPSSLTTSSDDNQIYNERAIDVVLPINDIKKSYETISVNDEMEFQSSIDNITTTTMETKQNLFKPPLLFDNNLIITTKRLKKTKKERNSCDNLDRLDINNETLHYKLSPKVYGLSKPNHSCEELNNLDCIEKYNYGSLQDLYSWNQQNNNSNSNNTTTNNNGNNNHNYGMRNIAQSEPDVRISRNQNKPEIRGEDNDGTVKRHDNNEGPALWATSFERLLDDPFGLHTFAEFLKKEFSAENIYFWTACERYRRLTSDHERIQEAQRIYQQHLCVGAPEPVNVDCQARHCTEQCLQEAKIDLFDAAQKQIFNLMKFDSYPRFLKSQLYKECLNGAIEKQHTQIDAGLLIQPPQTSQSKLKKSLSNAEDRRRKSLLPWHRKNRSKSKDRGESEYSQKQRNDLTASSDSVNDGKNEIHSSKSSLTSLDLAITNSQDLTKGNQDENNPNRPVLCRVILNNGSTTVVQIKQSETIQQLVNRLLEKRGLNYSAFEIYTDKHSKTVDINEPSNILAGCEVTIDQRVVFKLDLPNRKVISVKSKCTKLISDVLRPILAKYNYNLDHAKVILNENDNTVVDLTNFVTSIDKSRLKILINSEPKQPPPPPPPQPPTNPIIKINNVKVSKLEEITNQVFEGILQEKADSASIKSKCDKGSVKSEDWGSEHSSGIFGRFLRRDSGLHERKKKALAPRTKIDDDDGDNNNNNNNTEHKKPLIAKWKTGVNKMQIAPSESDELVEGLTRAQRSRLEDQRGTEINFELPDFLKDNNNSRKLQNENSRFYVSEYENRKVLPTPPPPPPPPQQQNYENRTIITKGSSNSMSPNKLNNLRMCSPNKLSDSNQSTPLKCDSLENTVIENRKESPKSGEPPPPLPPKPKIIPIKPSNWGQNGVNRNKEIVLEKGKTTYLEQPSSSFV